MTTDPMRSALEKIIDVAHKWGERPRRLTAKDFLDRIAEVIEIARTALSQAQPEPVAWRYRWASADPDSSWDAVTHENMLPTNRDGWVIEPLYVTHPETPVAGGK